MMDILERLRSVQNTCVQYAQGSDIMRDAADEITRLRAELESATEDAERYRWMKSEGKCMRVDTFKDNYRIVDASVDLVVTDWFQSFDEAIDAAMKG